MEPIKVEVTTTDIQVIAKYSSMRIPLQTLLRLFLGSRGIRYKDDGKLHAIGNSQPTPLGTLTQSYNPANKTITFTQIIPDETH